MRKHPAMSVVLYITDALQLFSFAILLVVFSISADLLPVPAESRARTGAGLVDRYGMRQVLLFLFLIAMAIDAILFMLARAPQVYKYPVHLTGDNIEAQYLLAKIVLGMSGSIVTLYFAMIMVLIYRMEIHFGDAGFIRLTFYGGVLMGLNWALYLLFSRKYR